MKNIFQLVRELSKLRWSSVFARLALRLHRVVVIQRLRPEMIGFVRPLLDPSP